MLISCYEESRSNEHVNRDNHVCIVASTPYFHMRSKYTVQDGLVFKGDRVVIPVSIWKEMQEAIHSSHIGIEGCIRRPRECIYIGLA